MSDKISLPPERSLGYQVRRCHRLFDRMLTAYLADHDLNSGFWYYLRALWIEDGLTQKELSDITHVTENTTATMIGLMIKKGLVTRTRDALDKRKLRVSLTARGRRLQAELMPYGLQINAIAAEGIGRAQIDGCLAVLVHIGENLQRALMQSDEIAHKTRPLRRAARRVASNR
jgi:MarR family transcriptional regulator, organic hydroperoxide resistance regulator